MFKIFKGKSELEKLYAKHKLLLTEAHKLSTVNRTKSDEKIGEAEAILEKIAELEIASNAN